MKVTYLKDCEILIEPETDFELEIILNFGHDDKKIKAFLKYGLTPADINWFKNHQRKIT